MSRSERSGHDRLWAGALAIVAACGRTEIASCEQDLGGIYIVENRRWIVIDHGATLEAFPLFPDVPVNDVEAPRGERSEREGNEPRLIEVGPRVIDLDRKNGIVGGFVKRRYMLGSDRCVARAPARITACRDNTVDILLSDPAAPIGVNARSKERNGEADCAWPRPDANRRERWTRD